MASYNDPCASEARDVCSSGSVDVPKESVSLRHVRLDATWENGVLHSGSRCFADTEEVTGSNPVAPTRMGLTRALVD